MKKITVFLSLFLMLAFMNVAVSQSQKKMRGKKVKSVAEKPIKKTVSDKKTFRAVGNSEGVKERTAKMKAEADAKRSITEQISVMAKTATEMYTKEVEVGDAADFESSMENLTMLVAKNELSGMTPAGFELYFKKKSGKNGMYNAYVLMEISRDDVMNAMVDKISKDDKLKVEFDKDKFKKVFEAEMDKLGGE